MKPFQCTLPATPVQVLSCELTADCCRQHLHMTLALRGTIQTETVVGNSIADVLATLTTRLGFSGEDASYLICTARGGN